MDSLTAPDPLLSTHVPSRAGAPIRWGLWAAQSLLAMTYLWSASMKLMQAPADLGAMIPWANDVPEAFLRAIGTVDLAAGLGILLPSITRIAPRLTVWAAVGASVLQVFAMVFHASRGEFAVLPFNAVLLALALFIAWGRASKAPIAVRR
ncbi:hypothetical protein LPB72_04995 [Hydrogenophaga crassostreae]|uniref:DoxX family protein n=1 Tax=Hydrogenophaga crassostreae TaxID=1763535 RepID=A0A167IMS6_9BURK|nr:DoxX family protein [Hydrogenophaga crassostreae]AOW14695.1 hypothetical protein LPB072_19555 [Hydrogenophaga crassostreae]OAD43208.1 hypothetical protein LPB72_04995 [Hydrogenophaga crassostreae]